MILNYIRQTKSFCLEKEKNKPVYRDHAYQYKFLCLKKKLAVGNTFTTSLTMAFACLS